MAPERKHSSHRNRPTDRRGSSRTPRPDARPGTGPSLLRLGTQALAEILRFATPADVALRRFFREHPKLGRRDRGIVAESVFAALRHLQRCTRLAGGRDPRRIFILGAREAGVEGGIAISDDERAWLAATQEAPAADATLAERAELPEWLIDQLRTTMSEDEILALGAGMQSAAPLDLRVNPLRTDRESAQTALGATGIESSATPYAPAGLRVAGKPALERHELYESGAIEVQDEGSQLLGHLLAARRREMVADFCAGAGGKTLHLGALMRSEGRLYAFDVSPQRLQRLRTRVARSGLSNVQAEVVTGENDVRFKRLAGKLDRVLVDAPCTGFGTLRRNPDLKWRQQPADLEALMDKQRRILDAAARLLKPGGRLVYATCSILPVENDAVVDDFLGSHKGFRELDCEEILAHQGIAIRCGRRLRLYPHLHGTDGFFAAVFERDEPQPALQGS